MKAAIFRGGDIVVDTLPEPVPAQDQALVKVLACGICGSDLHAAKHSHRMVEVSRRIPGRIPMDLDRDVVMGHEFCCEVIDYGPKTEKKLKPGTRVCAMPVMLEADGPKGMGYSNTYVGGYAEQMLLAAPLMLEVPNGLPTEHAALTEPLAVGVHAVEKGMLKGDEAPLVVGCGPVGLAVIAALRLKNIRPIVAADFSPKRRELAVKMGADIVVDPAQEDPYAQAGAGQARGGVRMRRRAGPDPADHGEGAARRQDRRGRRLHGARHDRADVRHREGAQPAVRAGLHARGVRPVACACWPTARSMRRR